jgi:hypothetical protein
MIRTAVLPFGRPGVISASMLALGRAQVHAGGHVEVPAPARRVKPEREPLDSSPRTQTPKTRHINRGGIP